MTFIGHGIYMPHHPGHLMAAEPPAHKVLSKRKNPVDGICVPKIGCVPDVWLLSACLLFIAILAWYCWRRRTVPGAKPLAIASLFGVLWMMGVLGQVMANDLSTKIAWYQFQVVWQLPAASAVTWFSLEFSGHGRRLTRRCLLLFAIPPLFAMLMMITNDLHHIWWRGFRFGETVRPVYGVGAWLLVGYGWTLVFVNLVVLVQLFVRSNQHRVPVVLIIAGQLACRVIFVAYVASYDLLATPYLLIATIMVPISMYGIALFGFRIFDPLPRARRTAIEQMQEGMIVLDSDNRLLSANPAAETIFGQSAVQLRGTTWQQLVSSQQDRHDMRGESPFPSDVTTKDGPYEISLRHNQDMRRYEVAPSPLTDQHENVVGWLVLLRDITARHRVQVQRLREQQMLAIIAERERLARELHDNLAQVFAFVNAQGQTARLSLARGDIAATDAQLARLVEVAREADSDIRESILSLRVHVAEEGFMSALSTYLGIYQQRYGIRIDLNGPADLTAWAMDPFVEVQLLRIIQEALTNVRKHARARCVCIDFARQNGNALVSLEDDGCGFDLREVQDSSGGRLGLRIMHERAEEAGGSLELQSIPGHGTRIAVRVPFMPPVGGITTAQEEDHAGFAG